MYSGEDSYLQLDSHHPISHKQEDCLQFIVLEKLSTRTYNFEIATKEKNPGSQGSQKKKKMERHKTWNKGK